MHTCGSPSAPQGDVELSCVSVHNVLDAAVTKQRRYGPAGTLCSGTLLSKDTWTGWRGDVEEDCSLSFHAASERDI